MPTPQPVDVRFARHGAIGLVYLDRPRALNALTLPMVRAIAAQLIAWQNNDRVHAVVLQGAPHPTKGPVFCAGADIRWLHDAALRGDPDLGAFFAEEFRLDHLIWTYPKPVIALLDGIVMGGGMGLAQGARLRVATERMQMAMPEVGIGYFPDVGAGYFLSRCPGRVGEYLAMTGRTVGAADALDVGLADVFVEGNALGGMLEALRDQPIGNAEQAIAMVRAHARSPSGAATLPRAAIDAHFAEFDVPSILRALRADGSAWATETPELLCARSPTMVAVALELIRRGRHLTLADDLRLELGMTRHAFASAQGEAVEGIRALVVDKDRTPHWSPSTHDAVDMQKVAAYFDTPWDRDAHPLRRL